MVWVPFSLISVWQVWASPASWAGHSRKTLAAVSRSAHLAHAQGDDHLEGVHLARVHAVLRVREGDQLVSARHLEADIPSVSYISIPRVSVARCHLEVEDPVLDVGRQEHLPLLPSQQQDAWTFRT